MRLKELQDYMRKKRIGCTLLINNKWYYPNMQYLCQFSAYGCLIIPKKGKPWLLVSKMERDRAKLSKNMVRVYKKDFYNSLRQAIKRCKRLGIDKDFLTVNEYSKLKRELKGASFVDVSKQISKLRAVKTDKEIQLIKKSCNLAVKVLIKCIEDFRYKTEADAIRFLEAEIKKKAGFSFEPLVASGKRACLVHHPLKRGKIVRGFLVIDMGVWLNGYCSDITRTFYIGTPTRKEIELYNLVLEAQKAAIAAVKPGVKCSEMYDIAKKKLGKMSRYFIHGLGHGVGSEVHELPNLQHKSKETLRAGNVVTVEPGIYIPNKFGIRIEDVVLVTGKGAEILTKMDKKLRIIKPKVY